MSSEVHSVGIVLGTAFDVAGALRPKKQLCVCLGHRVSEIEAGRAGAYCPTTRWRMQLRRLWRSRLSRWPRLSRVPRPVAYPLQHAAKKGHM